MSLSKAVITGKVVRSPEKRFTTNNVAITSFVIDINYKNSDEPALIRIITKGKLAEITADNVQKNKIVIVEGKLQNFTAKTESGAERKSMEIDANSVEIIGEAGKDQVSAVDTSESFDFDQDISGDDLIGEDEIPF